MRVLRSKDPERVARFGHIAKAGRGRARCGVACPGAPFQCSRARGHSGPHVAHGWLRRIDAAWDGPPAGRPATTSPIDRGYRGPPVRNDTSSDDPSLLARIVRGAIDRYFASFPETIMLIFFVAFIFFSIVWALQIL